MIPKGARDKFGINPGARLVVGSDENGIVLIPVEYFERKMKELTEFLSKE